MNLRRLTDSGISRFTAFLDSLSSDHPEPYPDDMLESEEDTVLVEPKGQVEDRKFASRHEAVVYLDGIFTKAKIHGVEYDTGLWAWLSLFYFDQLCKQDNEGNHRPGEMARWIPENDNFRKYYRHLLRGPFGIFLAHRDNPSRAMALLCGPLSEPGDVVEQLSARQELVTNPGVIQAATTLYYDAEKKRLKKGAGGRGLGSARRLADILNQFDVTWDLYGMSADSLSKLLPSEFERFKRS